MAALNSDPIPACLVQSECVKQGLCNTSMGGASAKLDSWMFPTLSKHTFAFFMKLIKENGSFFWNQMQLMEEAASAHRPWLLFAGSTLLSPARCRMGLVATVQGGGARID